MSEEYLDGIYAPVQTEVHERDLPVEGEIPSELRGSFLRNGPNPVFTPKGSYHIWDGDGMIHAVDFEGGSAAYRNKQVETAALQAERAAGRSLYGGLMDPEPPPPELTGAAGAHKNPANTNIIRHAGRLLALWEGGRPTVLTRDLDTVGTDDFAGKLQGPMTAHPKIDPETGELLFFGYSPFPPYLRYNVVDAAGKLVRSVDVDLPRPVMMHDFVVTRDHVVFFDAPMIFDLEGFAETGSMIRWAPEHGTRIGVMPRDGDGSHVRWFEVDPCYVFHFLNAYDDGDRVRITGASSEWVIVDFENEQAPEGEDENSHLNEWEIDLSANTCSTRRISELPGEFCKIPDSVAGLPHRYGYLSSFSSGRVNGAAFDAITKYDLERGTAATHVFEPGKVVGEVSFAPDPSGTAEDDGWLVTWLHEHDGSASQCVLIDARDVEAGPIARISMPQRVPLGFHGNWFAPEHST
jgi:carotenoid cleavage dioxygenase